MQGGGRGPHNILTIRALLRVLLGAMLLVVVAALAVPTWSDIDELRDAARVVAVARAGQSVFAALQYLRPERGTVQVALTAPAPAEAALLTGLETSRSKVATAIKAVLRDCLAARCADDDPALTALQGSIERLNAARRDTDAGIRLAPAQRAPGLPGEWATATTDILDRFDRISNALTGRVRLVDPAIAELMAVKQLGWSVRDQAGLERNFYSDGINTKSLPAASQIRMASYRGAVTAGWGMLRELTARPGAPATVAAAVQNAEAEFFGTYDKQRSTLYAALLAGQPPELSLADWLRVSTHALDSLIRVPNAAVAEAQTYAERRADDVERRLWLRAALLVLGILVGGGGFVLAQRRIISPIRATSATMRRLAEGDTTVAIAGEGRRDEIGEMIGAVVVFHDGMKEAARLASEREAERQRAASEKHAALVEMAEKIEMETATALEAIGARTAVMAVTAREMSASAARTGHSAQSAATASAQALATAQTVASAAEQLSASIREISVQVGQSNEIVDRAVAAGGDTRASIEALNEQVGRIGAVADMIGEIAARTNLLALNATIEAARAGDAGKGFAVVAAEVKALATQTARSTQEIGRHIAQVRGATGVSVAAVARIERTIGEINAIAGSIAAAVEQQGAATAEIARNVAETASAANDMTSRVSEVTTEAEQTGKHAADVSVNAAALDTAVGELRHSVIRVVRTSTAEVDRRRDHRYPVDIACRLSIAGGSYTARVADLSAHGAYIRDTPSVPHGTRGALAIDGVDFPLPFSVRGVEDDGLHLTFELDAATTVRFQSVPERLSIRRAA